MSEDCCKAILEQGKNKGKQCDRPKQENGYCGKHQKQAELEKSLTDDKRKCSKYRCMNTFIAKTTKQIEYCEDCLKEKEEALKKSVLCKSENCKSKPKESGYCGKHEPRALLLEEAEKEGIRICDDGKRACKNPTFAGKLKCEECLEKTREKEKGTYQKRKENGECTSCGVKIESTIKGIRGHDVQKCKKCYDIMREIEENRLRDINYKVHNKLNPLSHYNHFLKSAASRNLYVDACLTLDYFIEIVNKACTYCEKYDEHESIGIDRVDSSKGYISSNIVPCCEDCNRAKGKLDVESFEAHILRLAEKIKARHKLMNSESNEDKDEDEDERGEEEEVGKSYIRPDKITEMYVRNKFDEYIRIAIDDKRPQQFIDKLKELNSLSPKLTGIEFRKQIRNALFSERRAQKLTETGRKKIPHKEMKRLFEIGISKDAITLYTKVFGENAEINSDIEWLCSQWKSFDETKKNVEFSKFLVRCQNRRAKLKS